MATGRMFTVEEARTAGYQRGRNVSSGEKWAKLGEEGVPSPEGDDARPAVEDNVLFTAMVIKAHEAELADRETQQFLQSIEAKISGAENEAELWTAFDEGVARGIRDDMNGRFEKRGKRGVQQ